MCTSLLTCCSATSGASAVRWSDRFKDAHLEPADVFPLCNTPGLEIMQVGKIDAFEKLAAK